MSIVGLVLTHPTADLMAAGTLLCATVSALPKPGDYQATGGLYGVIYRLLNAIVPLVPHRTTAPPNQQ